jgi:hypothetical protein
VLPDEEAVVPGRWTLVVDSNNLGAKTAAVGLNEVIVTCSEQRERRSGLLCRLNLDNVCVGVALMWEILLGVFCGSINAIWKRLMYVGWKEESSREKGQWLSIKIWLFCSPLHLFTPRY